MFFPSWMNLQDDIPWIDTVMAPLEPGSEEEELELGPSNRNGTPPFTCSERPGAEGDAGGLRVAAFMVAWG